MRKLQIKFPSQIRISGWDFGSSARAMNQAGVKDSLMTYESVSKTQADLRKGRRSTTERKSMSTKTTIKRIALVAVSALGLGVLTTVSANAAADVSALSAGTPAPARVNVTGGLTAITATSGSGTGNVSVSAQIVSAPATSTTAVLGLVSGTGTISSAVDSQKTDQLAADGGDADSTGDGIAYATFADAATSKTFGVTLKADIAGTYQILVTVDSASGYVAGKYSTTYSVTTSGTPTSIAVAAYAGAATSADANAYGQLFAVTLKDASGNATVLGLNESLNVDDNSDSETTTRNLSGSAGLSTFSPTDDVKGVYYVRVIGATVTTGTGILNVTGAGLLPSTLVAQGSITKQETADAASGATIDCSTSTNCPSAKQKGAVTLKISGLDTTTTAAYYVAAKITNKLSIKYTQAVAVAKASATATFTSPSVDSTYTGATVDGVTGATSATYTLAYEAPAAKTIAVVGNTTALSATAGKTTWTIQAKDQYGSAAQYVPVSVTVAGRNTVATTALGVTDASGFISYSLTDAGTTGTKDTLTFASTASGVSSVYAYVNYGTVTVGTVTIKGGNNTTTGVAATSAQWKDIDAGVDGASATTHDVVATVKDASGNLVAGVPVTFTVSGTGAAITSNTTTVLTGTAGTATAQVYAWVAGTYTVTATAGGKSGTSSYQFRQSGSGEERVLSASVAGNLVTAKVVDRFGNPVPGVSVYASVTGGYLGTGTLKADDTTDNDGLVSFIVNGGASTVTLRTYNAATASAPYGSGQTCARAGASDCNIVAADDTAFTASVAGTAAKAEAGVGASFAPAGVASVTVDVAVSGASDSVDAANEATDAANAATDAANAAAEAADAATAAAQDAQAAVAALATSVASLIAGIKAQITTLTNLVIKIQKKVKA